MTGPGDDSAIGIATKAFGRLARDDTPPPYLSPHSRERILRIALLALAGAAAVAAFAALERLRFAGEAIRIGAVTPDRLDRVASHWTIAELLVAIAAVVAAVAWLAWFARVYGNLPALGARWTTVSRFNGVFCCALPVLNLFMAPKLWLETWRASEFDSGPGADAGRRIAPGRPTALLLACPTIGLLTVVLAFLGQRKTDRALDNLDPVLSAAPLQILAAIGLLASAVITLRLAQALTTRQEVCAARRGAAKEEPS
jgi:hypothetical protein